MAAKKKAPARKRNRPTTKAGREAARLAKPAASMGDAVDRALAGLKPITLAPGELQAQLDEAEAVGFIHGRDATLDAMKRQQADSGPHDHHMDGDERKPGLGLDDGEAAHWFERGWKAQEQDRRKQLESAHNNLIEERLHFIRPKDAERPSAAPDSTGLIEEAAHYVDTAIARVTALRVRVEEAVDRTVGPLPPAEGNQGSTASYGPGTMNRTRQLLDALHMALSALEQQVDRLGVL